MEKLLPKNKVHFEAELSKQYSYITLAEDGICINFNNDKNLRLICNMCGDYKIFGKTIYGARKVLIGHELFRCTSKKHFYCVICYSKYCCSKCIVCKQTITTFTNRIPDYGSTDDLNYDCYVKLKYMCKWSSCRKFFSSITLKNHEKSCEAQPKRECPVNNCLWKGRIDEMESHFKDHKQSQMVFQNVIDCMESGKEYYLLILDKFVRVKYVEEVLGEVYGHNVNLEMCKESSSFVKPVGMLSANNTLLKNICEGDNSVNSIHKNVALLVYFEKRTPTLPTMALKLGD